MGVVIEKIVLFLFKLSIPRIPSIFRGNSKIEGLETALNSLNRGDKPGKKLKDNKHNKDCDWPKLILESSHC